MECIRPSCAVEQARPNDPIFRMLPTMPRTMADRTDLDWPGTNKAMIHSKSRWSATARCLPLRDRDGRSRDHEQNLEARLSRTDGPEGRAQSTRNNLECIAGRHEHWEEDDFSFQTLPEMGTLSLRIYMECFMPLGLRPTMMTMTSSSSSVQICCGRRGSQVALCP